MSRIINLTHTIKDKMKGYPGDPIVSFKRFHKIKDIGYNFTELTLGTHSGTHIDVPYHCITNGSSVDKIDINKCIGEAIVVNLNKDKKSQIDVQDFKDINIKKGSKILIKTGWSKYFGKDSFFVDFPGITPQLAKYFISKKVSLIGLEQPSVNPIKHLEVHKILLSGGVVIVETMKLNQIKKNKVFLIVIPLFLRGLDGSPVGAVAIE